MTVFDRMIPLVCHLCKGFLFRYDEIESYKVPDRAEWWHFHRACWKEFLRMGGCDEPKAHQGPPGA